MKLSRVLTMSAVSGTSLLFLTACGTRSQRSLASDQTLNWVVQANLPTMDPSQATDVVSAGTLNNVDEGLLRIGQNAKLRQGVAKAYSVAKDGKTWTFDLRHSKWSNGDPVTAQDFVYGWRRTVARRTASQYAYLYDHVRNYSAVNKGRLPASTLGVQAVSRYRLVVNLSKPQSYFKYLVGLPAFFPQSQKVVTKYGDRYATRSTTAVYNGPFRLTGWHGTNNSWVLQKNPVYWDAKAVKLKRIKFQVIKDQGTWLRQYQSGKVDELITDGTQYRQFKSHRDMHLRRGASMFYLEFNQRRGIFKNEPQARRAISLAINRQQLTKNVLADGSQEPKGLIPTGLAKRDGVDFTAAASVKAGTTYDLTQAKSLWQSAMKRAGKKRLTLTILADDTSRGRQTAEFIQSQLARLPGLKVTTTNLPFQTRLSRSEKGDFDLVISGWIANFPDVVSFSSLFTSDNSYNRGHWRNSDYDAAVKAAEGKDANHSDARWQDLVTAERILMKQQGIVPLYQPGQAQLLNPRVHGIQYFPTGAQWDFSHAYLSKTH